MWIRSQDKRFLVDIDNACITERRIVNITSYAIRYHKEIDINLGVYSSYENAMKVLDKIHKYLNYYIDEKECSTIHRVFQMPLNIEVEILKEKENE